MRRKVTATGGRSPQMTSNTRRLRRMVVSSEENDDDFAPPTNPTRSVINDRHCTSSPSSSNPLVISDDDDDEPQPRLREPRDEGTPTPTPSPFLSASPRLTSEGVEELLRALGLRPRSDWLHSCLEGIHGGDVECRARLCFQRLLLEDMNVCGGGVLPPDLHSLHDIELEGPFVLQVDEIVNISVPLRDRYQKAHPGPKRCLKLSMTDGVQRVFALEYRPIRDLDVLSPVGLKVVIRNVVVRHGLLILVPEIFRVLGGSVQDLKLARERIIHELSKPYRGKRKQSEGSLSERASHAAWASSDQVNTPISDERFPFQGSPSGIVVGNGNDTQLNSEELTSSVPRTLHRSAATCINRPVESLTASRSQLLGASNMIHISSGGPTIGRHTFRSSGAISSNDSPRGIIHHSEDLKMPEDHIHPTILTREMEMPFTYMTCLLAKFDAEGSKSTIHGKIKCFLTGVKRFLFKDRDTYELLVYVDDGSLIFEAVVDHLFVQKVIGYSPRVVDANLQSMDEKTVLSMKEMMKNFQRFLANFEGVMIVEITGRGSTPVARELIEGCSTSDAGLLMSRLMTLAAY